MKKISLICIALIGLGFSSVSIANESSNQADISVLKYSNNKEYITLQTEVSKAPEVVEFFSFYCPHCFDYETKYGIPKKIQENLPNDIKMTKYHVDFMGGMSPQLSEAWAVAVVLGVDDKVGPAIFDSIHTSRNLKSPSDILEIFEKVGISEAAFNEAKNSVSVGIFQKKQENAIKDFQVQSVPTFYVDGKYMVNTGGLSRSKPFDEQFSDVINFLLSLDGK
ncbi:DsbA family protein [Thorsellia anophelis]|uniref:Thiol:disulfide interchange protein n=1 Tax=Thorsellia anophelis DSM 18579 TaxID=1123402 RepID=A0A1I0F589_9GAMM|nr:DsbA family protein [Thorsellia anophelis]SET52849.1 thiol:disulfide interchange protein DsbA [Thorsellia anophelis DSM 18579]